MPLRVSEINIYPVKSLGGISLQAGVVLKKGLQHDRRWMLVDDENVFLTQRVHNKMALFRMSFANNGFNVSFEGQQLNIPFTNEGDLVRAKIWDDGVAVREVSAAHSEWFTKNLGLHVKLVAFPEENERPVDPRYAVGDDHVSLADAYPLLIIGQSSLDDLNDRLKIPVPMNRFRPSVVFTGGEPFEEDTWSRFIMGGITFAGVKPSKRCVLITIDQETGQKGAEPLATLSTFRKRDNGVYFGQNIIPITTGKISIGDEITVNSSINAYIA
jgi:uncharacterized protein YcbX